MTDTQIAKGLGWFSLALGATQLIAPRWLSRQIGVEERPRLMRAFGLREIASGVGVLSQRRPAAGLWARVAGDAMDLAALGAEAKRSPQRQRLTLAIGMVAGAFLLDLMMARRM
jgi:hypothetical protein